MRLLFVIVFSLTLCGCVQSTRQATPTNQYIADDMSPSGVTVITVWSNGEYAIFPQSK